MSVEVDPLYKAVRRIAFIILVSGIIAGVLLATLTLPGVSGLAFAVPVIALISAINLTIGHSVRAALIRDVSLASLINFIDPLNLWPQVQMQIRMAVAKRRLISKIREMKSRP